MEGRTVDHAVLNHGDTSTFPCAWWSESLSEPLLHSTMGFQDTVNWQPCMHVTIIFFQNKSVYNKEINLYSAYNSSYRDINYNYMMFFFAFHRCGYLGQLLTKVKISQNTVSCIKCSRFKGISTKHSEALQLFSLQYKK